MAKEPMNAVYDIAPGNNPAHIALIMLPGVRDKPEDFTARGFVQEIRDRHLPVDVIAVDAHMDYYLQENTAERLTTDVIAPLRSRGYTRIWLFGLSLGGLGAIDYASRYPAEIEGMILLAPYVGSRGFVMKLERDGNLDDITPSDIGLDEQAASLWSWIANYRSNEARLPKIYIGYGEEDRLAAASRLLSAQLPSEQVMVIHGGHDWPTWTVLWRLLLDKHPFAVDGRHAVLPAKGD